MKAQLVSRTDTLTREEWLELRTKGIGGSDAGILMGVSPYKSRFGLWAEKTGKATSTFSGNEATEWGHDLELLVAQKYAKRTNAQVLAWPVMLAHPKFPFMQANVDFFIVEGEEEYFPKGEVTQWNNSSKPSENIVAILEIKTTGIATRGDSRGWEGDKVPQSYVWQGAHYAAVTGISKVVYAALVGGQGLQIRERTFPKTTLDLLIREEDTFWEQVQKGAQPDPVGNDDDFALLKEMYPLSNSEEATADHDIIKAVQVYRHTKAQITELEGAMKEARAKIEHYMGAADTLMDEAGNVLLTYKSNKTGTALDVKALTDAHPELIEKYQVTKPGARVLRIKEEK